MYQRWEELLFAHWEVPAEVLQNRLPPGLTVDTFEGRAYLGVVPFFMSGVRPAYLPAVPWLSSFRELNLRTYVYDRNGLPGVWFFSLDCSQPVAVAVARTFFHLPYHFARMNADRDDDRIWNYTSQRRGQACALQYRYRLDGEVFQAQPGTLDYFLIERYVLFSWNGKSLFSGRVHHVPYPLKQTAQILVNPGLMELEGFKGMTPAPCHVTGSHGVTVEVFALEKISEA
jgi:uncharacterized protein YqjF (DUF2071 family)